MIANQLALIWLEEQPDSALWYAKTACRKASPNQMKIKAVAHKIQGTAYRLQQKFDSAMIQNRLAIYIFDKLNDIEELVEITISNGLLYRDINSYKKALEYYRKAFSQAKHTNHPDYYRMRLYVHLSEIYYASSDIDKGLFYQDSAQLLINHFPKDENLARLFSQTAAFYETIGRYDKSILFYTQAIQIYEKINNQYLTAKCYNNLGLAYSKIYNFSKSVSLLQKSLEIKKKLGDSLGIASTSLNLGSVFSSRKDFQKAYANFNKALNIYERMGATVNILKTADIYAKTLLADKKPKQAISICKKYLPVAEKYHHIDFLSSLQLTLSKAYENLGNPESALKAYQQYDLYKDTLNEQLSLAKIKSHEWDMKLSRLEATHEITQEVPDTKTFFIISNAIIVMLLALIVWLLLQRRKQQKQNQQWLTAKETALNTAKEELSKAEQKLESKIRERTQTLQKQVDEFRKKDIKLKKALREVEDANYLKNAFLSNMSHEIRTPLNGIIGFASLLETELSLLENQELYEYANGIQKSGDRLLHLLNNLIDISRIEANDLQISLQESNISQIVEQSADMYKFKAQDKGLRFNVKLDDVPPAYIDQTNTTRIVTEVINNAVKYTNEGFINILTGYENQTLEVFVKVKDTGIGIDKAFLPKIFDAFRQESLGYSRQYQGAGLGLPLTKRLLDLMDGRIDIQSEKGKGTVITLFFPVKQKIAQPSKSPDKKKHAVPDLIKPLEDIRLFLVEDDRMNRLVIEKMLTGNWNVVSAVDGDDTIKIIDEAHRKGTLFDIMLFDINLPHPWDGIRLMQHVRKKYPEYQNIPFIAQTAYAMRGDKEKLLEAGFDDYLSKPLSQQRLLTTIYNFLKKPQAD